MSVGKSLIIFMAVFYLNTPFAHAGCLSIFKSKIAAAVEPTTARNQHSLDQETLRKARDHSLTSDERKKIIEEYAKPKHKPLWQKAFVYANWVMAGIVGSQVASQAVENPKALIPAIVLAPAALWLADLGGQVFHKWLDSYASEENPIWGHTAREFRIHHEVPDNLNREGYVSNVSPASVLLAPLFGAAAYANLSPEAATPLMVFLMSIMHTTEFHKQSHLKKPNTFFKFLQKTGLAIDHDAHMDHHRPPFDKEFSVFLGWSNGFADKANLWNKMDQIFWKYTGKMPHNWIQDPRSIPDGVASQIQSDLSLIPSELWASAETYPNRVPKKLEASILKAKERWQKDFFGKRRTIFQEKAIVNYEEALKGWEQEQKEYPWLYNDTVQPLYADGVAE